MAILMNRGMFADPRLVTSPTPTTAPRVGTTVQMPTAPAETMPRPTRTREPYIDSGPIIANPGGMLPIPTKQAPIVVGTPAPTKGVYQSPPIIAQPGQAPIPTQPTTKGQPVRTTGGIKLPMPAPAPAPAPAEEPSTVKTLFSEYFPETRREPTSPYESPPIIAQPGQIPLTPPPRVDDGRTIEEGTEVRATEQFDEMGQQPQISTATPTMSAALAGTGDMGINIALDIPGIETIDPEEFAEEYYSQYGDRLFPYMFTARNDDLNTGQGRSPIQGQSLEMVSARDLRSKYNRDNYLQKAFGTFDNYIGFLTGMMDLAEKYPEIAWWTKMPLSSENMTVTGVYDPQSSLYGLNEEDARMGSGARIDAVQGDMAAGQQMYDAMLALPEYQELLQKHNVNTQFNLSGSDQYVFNGLTATEVYQGRDTFGSAFEQAMNIANTAFLGYATGQLGTALAGAGAGAGASAGATAGAGTTANVAGAVLGNAVNQGLTTGRIDVGQLVTAGLSGYISSITQGLESGTLSGTRLDNTIWDLSGRLNLSYQETLDIIEGAASGLLSGGDIEGIITGAVAGYTAGQIKNAATDFFGSEIDIDNVFDEGTTTIPTSAINPLIDAAVEGAFQGQLTTEDVLRSLVDYSQEEGSFAFLDPGLDLPDFDIDVDLLSSFETPAAIREIEDVVRAGGRETEDITRAVGSYIDDEIIQPIREAIPDTPEAIKEIEDLVREAGSELEDVVRAAGSEAEDITRAVGSYIDDEIIQPIREMLPEISLPEGPDIDLPSVDTPDLPSISFPSIPIGALGGMGGTGAAREFQRTDPGGITYDPTLPELYLIQPNRSGMLV